MKKDRPNKKINSQEKHCTIPGEYMKFKRLHGYAPTSLLGTYGKKQAK